MELSATGRTGLSPHSQARLKGEGLMLEWFCLTAPLNWFMTLPPEAMTSQATALTSTVTSAMTGALAVWLGHKK